MQRGEYRLDVKRGADRRRRRRQQEQEVAGGGSEKLAPSRVPRRPFISRVPAAAASPPLASRWAGQQAAPIRAMSLGKELRDTGKEGTPGYTACAGAAFGGPSSSDVLFSKSENGEGFLCIAFF